MKLSKQEVEKIAKRYNLGKTKSIKLINGGAINYNFDLITDKGNFIIRVLGNELQKWKRDKLKLEFAVLNYLKKANLPYKFPEPEKTKTGKILSHISGHNLWIYKRLEGEVTKKVNLYQMKEIAKALADYHKSISKINIKKWRVKDLWILNKYEKMKKIVPKNRIDKLMLKNIVFFEKHLKESGYDDFNENVIVIHADFNKSNILFKGNKITAILDFDNLEFAPRARDIAYTMKRFCSINGTLISSRETEFLKEYEKVNPLTSAEKKMIYPLMMRDSAIIFWWYYCGKKKIKKGIYKSLKETIENAKRFEKRLR